MNKTNLPLYVNAKELPYGKKDDSAKSINDNMVLILLPVLISGR